MKKYILGLIGFVFAFAMTFNLSSCSKEEEEVDETIIGTWRHYTDKTKGYYYQITLEKDGTLIWHEINEHEDENLNCTYTYKDNKIVWYWNDKVEAVWYVTQLYKTEMITYRVHKYTGEIFENERILWVKIK